MKYLAINNKILNKKFGLISAEQRLIRFGDGVFETCKIANHNIINFDLHLKRLKNSLSELKIKADISYLEQISYQLIKKNKLKNGFLRISISRGLGSKGYLPINQSEALIIVENMKFISKNYDNVILGISKYKRLSSDFLPINGKISNNLISIMAKIEAEEAELFDMILLNEKDEIAETSSANIFWKKDNIFYTPDLSTGIVDGVTRSEFIKNNKVIEVRAEIEDLILADEVLITNVNIGILKIDKITPF
ncbi:aminotransferase class IV [Rickettsiales bacterium]|nr:aminotransferase class IV [Rickettsiales bacterium]